MTINISIPDVGPNLHPQITVLGVGGSGGNAVNNMINSNLEGVDFAIANTDAQALQISSCKKKIQLGVQSTRGLGAGMRPDVGRHAAEETLNEISQMLEGSHMLFIAAGMGGGTGTGAAPVIAKLAREKGILTVGVVTKPFHFEGSQRMKLADQGLEELQQYVDTLLTIPNQNLFRIANEKTTFADAFKMADDVLYAGVRGVTDLMVQPGLINLDFSDVKTVMSEMGKAMMGTGEASGEGRAIAAAEAAIANPLIDDVSLKGAKGLIINITGGNDITLYEVDEAANRIKQEVDETANIIYGTTCDDRLEGIVRVSIVATGIDVQSATSPISLEKISTLSIDNSVYLQKSDPIEIKTSIQKDEVSSDDIMDNEVILSSNLNQDLDQVSLNKESDQNENISLDDNLEDLNNNELDDSLEDLNNNELDDSLEDLNNNENKEINYEDNANSKRSENEDLNDDLGEIKKELDSSVNDLEKNHIDADSIISKEHEKPNVRRLSLFDSLEQDETTKDIKEVFISEKSEPVFDQEISKEYNEIKESETMEEEFSNEVSDSDTESEFNQEQEEELLDIPTFLRRQAN